MIWMVRRRRARGRNTSDSTKLLVMTRGCGGLVLVAALIWCFLYCDREGDDVRVEAARQQQGSRETRSRHHELAEVTLAREAEGSCWRIHRSIARVFCPGGSVYVQNISDQRMQLDGAHAPSRVVHSSACSGYWRLGWWGAC